jgi:hypothetical protein
MKFLPIGNPSIRAKTLTVPVPAATTGVLFTATTKLKPPVAFGNKAGNANLSIHASTGAVSAAAGITAGQEQTITFDVTGDDECVQPWSLTLAAEADGGGGEFEAAYSFTRVTADTPLFTRPNNMDPADRIYAFSVVDVRDHPLYADPDAPDFLLYTTTDHTTGRGGCWLWCCKGDPRVPANWMDYEDALTDGWFDTFATKPAGNPIFVHEPFVPETQQCETFNCLRIGDQFVATYQVDAGVITTPLSRSQTTVRTPPSDDGINWVSGTTNLIQVAELAGPVDGHVGYYIPQKNDLLTGIPYEYWAKSLAGGTTRSVEALWGVDDPIAGTPTLIGLASSIYGPAMDAVQRTGSASDPRLPLSRYRVRETPQGLAAIVVPSTAGSAGENTYPVLWEVLISDDGLQTLSEPIQVLGAGAAGKWDERSVGSPAFIEYEGDLVLIYRGSDAAGDYHCGIAVSPLSGAEPSFTELPIKPPATFDTEDTVDWTALSDIPAGWTELLVGTVLPTKSYGAGGISITLDGTASPTKPDWFLFRDAGFVPNDTEFVDFLVRDMVTTSSGVYRDYYVGFTNVKTANAITNSGRAVSTGVRSSHNGDPAFFVNYDGVARSQNYDTIRPRPGYGAGGNYIWGKSKKLVGLRWYCKEDRFVFLGEGMVEQNELGMPFTQRVDKSLTYYPFVCIRGIETATTVERMTSMRYREKGSAGSGVSSPMVYKRRVPLFYLNHLREIYKIGASVFTSRAAFEADSRVTLIGGTNGQYAIDLSAHTADLSDDVTVICDANVGAAAVTSSRRMWTLDDGNDGTEGDEALFGYWGTDLRCFAQAIHLSAGTLTSTQTNYQVETASTRVTHGCRFTTDWYYHSGLANTLIDTSGAMPTGLSRLLIGGNALNATRTFGGSVEMLAIYAGDQSDFNVYEIEAMKNMLV